MTAERFFAGLSHYPSSQTGKYVIFDRSSRNGQGESIAFGTGIWADRTEAEQDAKERNAAHERDEVPSWDDSNKAMLDRLDADKYRRAIRSLEGSYAQMRRSGAEWAAGRARPGDLALIVTEGRKGAVSVQVGSVVATGHAQMVTRIATPDGREVAVDINPPKVTVLIAHADLIDAPGVMANALMWPDGFASVDEARDALRPFLLAKGSVR